MGVTSKQIADKLKYVKEDPNPRSAAAVLHELLLFSLSPTQSEIYNNITEFGECSSMEIAQALSLKQNNCTNQLKVIHGLGLVERTVITEKGIYYTWRIK